VEGAAEHRPEIGGPVDLVSPLHQSSRHAGQVAGQERLGQQVTPVLLPAVTTIGVSVARELDRFPIALPQAGGGVQVDRNRLTDPPASFEDVKRQER
jgi:hypothetical protein